MTRVQLVLKNLEQKFMLIKLNYTIGMWLPTVNQVYLKYIVRATTSATTNMIGVDSEVTEKVHAIKDCLRSGTLLRLGKNQTVGDVANIAKDSGRDSDFLKGRGPLTSLKRADSGVDRDRTLGNPHFGKGYPETVNVFLFRFARSTIMVAGEPMTYGVHRLMPNLHNPSAIIAIAVNIVTAR